jgi:hypothetical protein
MNILNLARVHLLAESEVRVTRAHNLKNKKLKLINYLKQN